MRKQIKLFKYGNSNLFIFLILLIPMIFFMIPSNYSGVYNIEYYESFQLYTNSLYSIFLVLLPFLQLSGSKSRLTFFIINGESRKSFLISQIISLLLTSLLITLYRLITLVYSNHFIVSNNLSSEVLINTEYFKVFISTFFISFIFAQTIFLIVNLFAKMNFSSLKIPYLLFIILLIVFQIIYTSNTSDLILNITSNFNSALPDSVIINSLLGLMILFIDLFINYLMINKSNIYPYHNVVNMK